MFWLWNVGYNLKLNLKPNLVQGPWQNAQMLHIQYICHLNFKEDVFLANNACNLCTKVSNAHYMLPMAISIMEFQTGGYKSTADQGI
jgi:hypothetical protein